MEKEFQRDRILPVPLRIDCTKRILAPTYKKDEILVFFDAPPSSDIEDDIKRSFFKDGLRSPIEVVACKDCGSGLKYVQLWKAKGIHTMINTEGVRPTSSPTTKTHGEDYSLNFINNIPFDKNQFSRDYKPSGDTGSQKDQPEILIAVLDTGIDTELVDKKYLWTNSDPADPGCYLGAETGWNFVDNNAFNYDNHPGKHGSIVSQFIINEFKVETAVNRVKIMPLKTHDQQGQGDLFGIICAIHFAIAKGAKLINASWGFYYYLPFPNKYFVELISVILKKKGIVFVTPAGNQTKEDNDLARQIYSQEHEGAVLPNDDLLRNLEFHNFYPACLSYDESNVVTATTVYKEVVSPTQNYSEVYVDLGVSADEFVRDFSPMKFKLPFSGTNMLVSGSSFATAIASGKIGAHCDISMYDPATAKSDFFDKLPTLVSGAVSLESEFIKKGRYTTRW